MCWAAPFTTANCPVRQVFSAPSLVHFKWRCTCNWYSKCWLKGVNGSQEWSQEFVSRASSPSRKFILRTRESLWLTSPCGIVYLWQLSSAPHNEPCKHVWMSSCCFFSCDVYLRCMVRDESRETEKRPHFWNHWKSPKLFRILGDVIHVCLGVVCFSLRWQGS